QGNPYDGHTLSDTLWMIKNLHNLWPEEVYLDQGYKGFDGLIWGSKAYIAGKARNPPPNIKRRSSIEPVIGHMKHDHRLGRNHLLGAKGDGINAVMSGAGFNLRKLMAIVYVDRATASIREFAHIIGVDHSAVSRAIKGGERVRKSVVSEDGRPRIVIYEVCLWRRKKRKYCRNIASSTIPTKLIAIFLYFALMRRHILCES
ncbi:MAG TPA: hypothetical protein VE954_07455, partial [Oligoflexus sp.]|nr:hypothetical protein [Oligoflexus sp.]